MMMSQTVLIAASLVLAAGSATAIAGQPAAAPVAKPTAASPVAATAAAPAVPSLDAKLPTDPALITGTLENGLGYIIRPHNNPEGRVSVWLHISTGSLNETESTRGIAHFLEHMAFNGSKNFPPNSVINFFQSLGLQFGRDQNAFTSFEQTAYQLALPDNKPETTDKALLFMSDVGGRLSLLLTEIDNERGIIQEERRTRLSAQQRVQEYVYARLAPESTFGRRLPIGTVETITSMTKADFENYYNTFYVPSNMTVIVVGDVDPAATIKQITAAFADLKKVPRPADLDVGIKPTAKTRAIVATDPELTNADVSINRISNASKPSVTVGDMRRDLVDTIGTWAFNRRIAAKMAKGDQPYLSAAASSQDVANTVKFTAVNASGKTENWKAMLREVAKDLVQARQYGFTDRELADARSAIFSQAEEAAVREATLPARAHLGRINNALAALEPVMSAQQRVDLLKALLPSLTVAEVSKSFADAFDPTNVVFIAELPSSGDVPTEEQLIALGREALAVKVEKGAEEARAESLMTKLPTAGKFTETATHEGTAVTSAWLDNGVRVHFKAVDKPKDEVSITISLAGGEVSETAQTRGTASAAGLAWGRAATKSLPSTQIRDLMTGKKVRVGGGGGTDSMSLAVSGSPEQLETGLQLAHLLLTEPLVEAAALQQWKQSQEEGIKMRASRPEGLLVETMSEALLPKGEVRGRPLVMEQVNAVTVETAQAWLDRTIRSAPIEVSIVGDIKKEAAMELVARYLGSLPKRERISAATLESQRRITRNTGPIAVSKSMKTKTDKAIVMDGFTGPDIQQVADVRLMQLASRILSTRMVKVIREEKQLVYSISAQSQPGTAYRGSGMFMASAPTDPAKADALPAALDELYTEFAKTGPTTDELDVARNQLIKFIEEQMKEPAFWTGRLASLDYRGGDLNDVVSLTDFYKNATAKDIQEVFAKYYKPSGKFQFVVKPEASAGG